MNRSNLKLSLRVKLNMGLARSIFILFLTFGFSFSSFAQSEKGDTPKSKRGQIIERVAAVVNEEIILFSDVMARFAPIAPNIDQIPDARERKRRKAKLLSDLLNELINEELIAQSAQDQGLKVDLREIQAAIDDIKKQNNLDDNQFAEALRGQGMSMSAYRKDLKRQIVRMRAVNMTVRPKVNVSDDDVKAKFDSQSQSPNAIDKVKLQHILIALPAAATEDQKTEANQKAAAIVVKAQAGEDFAALAKEFSDDPSTKDANGELGWIERGTIATEWEDVVFSMKANETRGPVQGPNGLHIFHIADIKTSEVKSFDDSKNEIRTQLFRAQMEKQTQIWLESLREKAHIDIKQAI